MHAQAAGFGPSSVSDVREGAAIVATLAPLYVQRLRAQMEHARGGGSGGGGFEYDATGDTKRGGGGGGGMQEINPDAT